MERFLTSDINNIDNSVLWSCIDDDMNDAILLEGLGKSLGDEEDSEKSPTVAAAAAASLRASRIIRHRTHILTYLQQNILQLLNNDSVRLPMPYSEEKCQAYSNNVLSLRGIARVFRMTVSVSTYLDGSNKVRQRGNIFDFILNSNVSCIIYSSFGCIERER